MLYAVLFMIFTVTIEKTNCERVTSSSTMTQMIVTNVGNVGMNKSLVMLNPFSRAAFISTLSLNSGGVISEGKELQQTQ